MRILRAPDGCPWDREQTHASLRKYLLEEAGEAVDALTSGDTRAIVDELGDVLLQVAFHAVIAEEEGTFDYEQVEAAIVDKLVRRHPHVFADAAAANADEVVSNWQAIKAREREERGEEAERPAHERVPHSLPSLQRAAKVAKLLGNTPADGDAQASDAQSIGRQLYDLAQLARRQGIDPEVALREATLARIEEANSNTGTTGEE